MRARDVQFPLFLIPHLAMGIAIGWAVLAGLLWLDVARLGTLLFASSPIVEGLFMLMVVFAVTFGGAIMGLGHDDGTSGGPGRRARLARRADGKTAQIAVD